MNKRSLQVLVALLVVASTSFSAQERVIRFMNRVQVGYDTNIYKTTDDEASAFITDIMNLSAKMNFSSRSDLLLYWQPEFQYRFDADPKFVTYQDLYGKFSHALSQKAFLTVSDRFRYQQKEGQVGSVDDYNANFIENDLMGAFTYQFGKKSDVKVGAGYEFRTWDDENYGKTQHNDYQQIKADASYLRVFKPNKTTGVVGLNYVNHEYDGSRGGYDAVSALIGVDQNFSATLTSFARVGASFNSVDSYGSKSDTTSPYFQAGMEYSPSARTSLTGGMGYSMYRSENTVYNAQDRFNVSVGVRHDLTAKVNLSSSLSYIFSDYDSSYSSYGVPDAEDNYLAFSLRGAYQINRNNFVEAGYLFQDRSTTGALADWDSNRIDFAWRLRL